MYGDDRDLHSFPKRRSSDFMDEDNPFYVKKKKKKKKKKKENFLELKNGVLWHFVKISYLSNLIVNGVITTNYGVFFSSA